MKPKASEVILELVHADQALARAKQTMAAVSELNRGTFNGKVVDTAEMERHLTEAQERFDTAVRAVDTLLAQ